MLGGATFSMARRCKAASLSADLGLTGAHSGPHVGMLKALRSDALTPKYYENSI